VALGERSAGAIRSRTLPEVPGFHREQHSGSDGDRNNLCDSRLGGAARIGTSSDRRGDYGEHHSSRFTFLDHPEIAADNNDSERALRPTATYRKVTGGFRSTWGTDLKYAVVPVESSPQIVSNPKYTQLRPSHYSR